MDEINPIPFSDFKKKVLKNPKIKAEYRRISPVYEIINAVVIKRIETGMTQKQLAEKMGTKQSALSRLESGNYNPSLAFIQKLATALDTTVHIKFESNKKKYSKGGTVAKTQKSVRIGIKQAKKEESKSISGLTSAHQAL